VCGGGDTPLCTCDDDVLRAEVDSADEKESKCGIWLQSLKVKF
jgi:hypothetical protein